MFTLYDKYENMINKHIESFNDKIHEEQIAISMFKYDIKNTKKEIKRLHEHIEELDLEIERCNMSTKLYKSIVEKYKAKIEKMKNKKQSTKDNKELSYEEINKLCVKQDGLCDLITDMEEDKEKMKKSMERTLFITPPEAKEIREWELLKEIEELEEMINIKKDKLKIITEELDKIQ